MDNRHSGHGWRVYVLSQTSSLILWHKNKAKEKKADSRPITRRNARQQCCAGTLAPIREQSLGNVGWITSRPILTRVRLRRLRFADGSHAGTRNALCAGNSKRSRTARSQRETLHTMKTDNTLVFPKVRHCPTCGKTELQFHDGYPDKELRFYECRADGCGTHFLVSGEYVFGLTEWKADHPDYDKAN